MNVIFFPNLRDPNTGSPVGYFKSAIDVAASSSVYLVGGDAAEAGSTNRSIVATAHAALRGDILRFTSGTESGKEVTVKSVTANGIEIVEVLGAAPGVGDTFLIYRYRRQLVDSSGNSFVLGVSGLQVLETRFHDMSSVTINDSAGLFVEIGTPAGAAIASTIQRLQLSYTAGEPLCFRIGANAAAAAANPNKFIINQGEGPTTLDISLLAGDRLWVRSLSATAVNTGYITLNLIG